MNWQHLRAFAWLRWRLLVNQWSRGGALNAVLMIVVTIAALLTAVPLLIGSFLLGRYAIPRAQPVQLLLAWDVLILIFLLLWAIELVAELQRTEPLSLSKFLHLPVSAREAFLLNYFSSLLRLSLILVGPVMLGFSLALVDSKGMLLLPVLPSLAAFLLMITALSYQFQGWLAALMSNPRRRRSVVLVTTAIFLMATQLPNLLNYFSPWGVRQRLDRSTALIEEMKKLQPTGGPGKLDTAEYLRRQQEVIDRHRLSTQQANREAAESLERTARLWNVLLPVGWLPMGVMAAVEGRVVPSILGLLGMTLIGTSSLWRAYHATVRQYRGLSTNWKARPAPGIGAPSSARKSGNLLLEARLPGLPEPVSAVALAGLQSLVRSPEAKMMMLTPVIMGPILGSMLWRQRHGITESMRPLVATGGMVFVLLGVVQMMGNLFGFDRDGFRAFVLCAAPRRDILLGKNLAFVPVVLGTAAILLTIAQVICPLRPDHLLAMVAQYVSMFLLFCICTNLLSIYAPLHVAPGSLRPSSPKMTTALLQVLMILILFPLTQFVTLVPLGIEIVLRLLGWMEGVPICLVLSLAECAAVVAIYWVSLGIYGELLRAREQTILESVASRSA